MDDASFQSGPDYTLTWTEFHELTISLLEKRVGQLLGAGRLAEAVGVYTEDIELSRTTAAAARKAGVPADARLDRARGFRTAHAMRRIGMIEALRVRVQPALDQTAQALDALRGLDREQREPIVYHELINAMYSFALVRAMCRRELAEAAEAVGVAVRMLNHLAAEGSGISEDFLGRVTLLEQQVQILNERLRDGHALGVPGSPLPGDASWMEEFSWLYRERALEQMEVPQLLRELRNADQAEALMRGMDERGDAEGSRKRGEILEALGDRDGAEAAYRRGAERGSYGAAYHLGVILRSRGDTQAALAAFTQAAASGDSTLSADARRALRKLARARRLPWPRRSPQSPKSS